MMELKPDTQIIIAGMLTGKEYYCEGSYFLVGCKDRVRGFRDRASAREYKVTKLCQNCQDITFDDKKI